MYRGSVRVDGATRWIRSDKVLWRRTMRGVALLPPGSEPPLTLTGSGAQLWEVVAEPRTLTETADILAERHGADPAVVAADVAPVLDELTRCGVLDARGGSP